MGKILTIGEAMGLFVAKEEGSLETINEYTRYTAGAEMNVAIGTSRLGLETCYVTQFGEDPIGRYIKSRIENENIDSRYITFTDKYMTGLQFKEKVSQGDPEVVSFRKNSAASKMTKENICNISFKDFNYIHLSGIFLALSEETEKVSHYFAEQGRKNNVLITFDPNLRPKLWESKEKMIETINRLAVKADIILPGISEGKILTGYDDEEKIADYYLDKGLKVVIVKLGEKGAYVKENGLDGKYIDGYTVSNIVDTVGAGDGFAVGVITALAEGLSIEEAARRGNAIGAIQLMSASDNEGLPNKDQLEEYMCIKTN